MKHKLSIIFLLSILQITPLFAWNATGHRLIAQIAYNNMTPHAQQLFNQYNRAMDKIYKPQSFIDAAVWLDTLRYQGISWFTTMHYVDLPFTNDGTPLPPLQEINALWAIEKSTGLLLNKYATNFDKGTAFRVILHVAGDLHQPLHAATHVSAELPSGDRGGNLVPITGTSIAKNLHAYWDNGAGALLIKSHQDKLLQATKRVASIESRWSCQVTKADTNPEHWADESHALAINSAYKELPTDNVPDKKYQNLVQKISERQIALAGCRIAALLNQIDENLTKKLLRRNLSKHTRRPSVSIDPVFGQV